MLNSTICYSSGSPTGPCARAVGMSDGMSREVWIDISRVSYVDSTDAPTEAGNFPVKLQ